MIEYKLVNQINQILRAKYPIGKLYATFFLTLIILVASCTSGEKNIENKLTGNWLRTDGPYTIEIKEVKEEGNLSAEYFNPNLINVGRAGWRIKNEELQMYVELRDENYPGSIYQLAYNEEADILSGTYYQAVSRQTYEVKFKRTN
jgi:hypothetical protein